EAMVEEELGTREPGAPAEAQAEAHASAERLTVGARALDPRYRPVAGARLAWIENDAGESGAGEGSARAQAVADRNGTILLVLEKSQLPAQGGLELRLDAPGFVAQTLSLPRARWTEGVCMLGEFVLLEAEPERR